MRPAPEWIRRTLASASSSSSGARGLLGLAVAAVLCAAALPAEARVLMTQEAALAAAFPGKLPERRTAYLTEEQATALERLTGAPPPTRVIVYYVGAGADGAPAVAWFDTHLVRTLPETVMILSDAGAKVLRVDVLTFEEPIEYLPRPRWFEQFQGRALDDSLAPGRGIPAVTGATLSSRAVTGAVRRCLALHAVLCAGGACRPAPVPAPAPAEAAP